MGKRCPSCKMTKPTTSEFWYIGEDGQISSYCILCTRKKRRDRRQRVKTLAKEIPIEKRCPKCGITKPADSFPKNSTETDGLHTWCRTCCSRSFEEYYYRGQVAKKRVRKKVIIHREIDHHGCIYLFRTGPYYKLGKSVNPELRFRGLQMMIPYPVEFVCSMAVDDMDAVELELHEKFAEKCHRGEWFLLNEQDVEFVKSIDSIPSIEIVLETKSSVQLKESSLQPMLPFAWAQEVTSW